MSLCQFQDPLSEGKRPSANEGTSYRELYITALEDEQQPWEAPSPAVHFLRHLRTDIETTAVCLRNKWRLHFLFFNAFGQIHQRSEHLIINN